MTLTAVRNPNRCPSHPGKVIGDILSDFSHSKTAVANALGISRTQLYGILDGSKPVTMDKAARLGKLFGNGPGFWLRLQAAHDAWHAEREIDVSMIPELEEVA